MTECLHIVDNPINMSSVKLDCNVTQAFIYGVGVSIVGVLLSQGIPGVRHGKLALNLVEYHSGLVALQVIIKVLGIDRGYAYICQSEIIWRVRLSLLALG